MKRHSSNNIWFQILLFYCLDRWLILLLHLFYIKITCNPESAYAQIKINKCLLSENNIYQLILEFFSAMQYQQSKKEKERTWNSEKAPTSYQFIPKYYDWICSYHYKTKITKLGSMLVEGEWRSLSNDTAINRYNSLFFCQSESNFSL